MNRFIDFLQRFQTKSKQKAILPPANDQLKIVYDFLAVGWYSNSFLLLEPAFINDVQGLIEPILTDPCTPFASTAFGDLFAIDANENVITIDIQNRKICSQNMVILQFLNQNLFLCPMLHAETSKAAKKHLGLLNTNQLYQFVLPPTLGGEWSVGNLKINSFLETIEQSVKIMKVFNEL